MRPLVRLPQGNSATTLLEPDGLVATLDRPALTAFASEDTDVDFDFDLDLDDDDDEDEDDDDDDD